MTAEEMERQNKFNNLNYRLKIQEKVIEVGERALVRAAVSKHRRRSHQGGSGEKKEVETGVVEGDGEVVEVEEKEKGGRAAVLPTNGEHDRNHVLSSIACGDESDSAPQNISDITLNSVHLPPRLSTRSTSTAKEADSDNDENASVESSLIMNDGNTVRQTTTAAATGDELPADADSKITNDLPDHKPPPAERINHSGGEGNASDDDSDDSCESSEFETAEEDASLPLATRMTMMTSQEIHETSMDDVREKETADRSEEWILEEEEDSDGDHNDNADSKRIRVASANKNRGITIISSLGNNPPTLPHQEQQQQQQQQKQSQTSLLFLSALSQPIENDTDPETNSIPTNDANSSLPPPPHLVTKVAPPPLTVGSIVNVQSRTWPGVNKPGGVARVKKVHDDADKGIQYDVAYILGGRERLVDCVFVSAHEDGQDTFVASCTSADNAQEIGGGGGAKISLSSADTVSATNLRRVSKRVSRRVGQRASKDSKKFDLVKEEGTRGTKGMAEDLKEEEEDGNKARRNRTTKKKSNDATIVTNGEEGTSKGTKSSAKQSKKRKAPLCTTAAKKGTGISTKKQRRSKETNATIATSTNGKSRSSTTKCKRVCKTSNTKKSTDDYSFTEAEVFKLAKDRFDSLLNGVGSGTDNVVKVVTSGLSDYDENMVKLLCAEMRGMDVTLKLWKDFNPQKANLCITTARPSTDMEQEPLLISNKRTVKAMRASLAGIPILTPAWIYACLEKKSLTTPEDHMVIHTLPTKVEHLMDDTKEEHNGNFPTLPSARFGVTTFTARYQKYTSLNGQLINPPSLLNNVSFLLCGKWQSNLGKRRDVQILLREGGSTLLTSGTQAVKKMKDTTACLENEEDDGCTIVFLCNDSTTDNGCGITNNVKKAARNLCAAWTDQGKDEEWRKGHPLPFLVVNTDWLFDCISCARILGVKDYEPSFPSAKYLWQLCMSLR